MGRMNLLLILAFAVITIGFSKPVPPDHYKGPQTSSYPNISAKHADDDDNDSRHRSQKRHRNGSRREDSLKLATNPTYQENCGACHFLFQAELLPSGSWERLLGGLDDHFGASFELDPEAHKVIRDYLETNSAEHSTGRRAVKIMKSLGTETPLRVTDVPYIKNRHHDISISVFKRQSIGSFSNCAACHKKAEEGIYDDDFVSIPE